MPNLRRKIVDRWSSYDRESKVYATRRKMELRLELSLEWQESRPTYERPVLFINSHSAVVAELLELSENQNDPVYEFDDVLDCLDRSCDSRNCPITLEFDDDD